MHKNHFAGVFWYFLVSLILYFHPLLAQDVTAENRPWTRWWWPGSAVDSANIAANLGALQQAGFGGVEITPIYGVNGYESSTIDFLSPRWMAMLDYTLHIADSLSLGVDMACGTGWPFGGPQITNEHAAKKIEIVMTTPDSLTMLNLARPDCYLLGAVAMNDKDEVIKRSSTLAGIKDKKAKRIILYYQAPTKQQVKRAAPGGEGPVMDHYSSAALNLYLARFDSAWQNSNTAMPRAFFNDSFEVYGANWTDEFFTVFKAQHGYDLRQHLAALAGFGNADDVARIKSDYRETLAAMLLENFTIPWTTWAHTHNSITRNQAHGSPANLLDLYAAVDIPEIEIFGPGYFAIPGLRTDPDFPHRQRPPTDPLILKFATSAANLTGKKLVSCETFTWLGEHFRVALSQCKPEVDQLFANGINHIFFHGATYSPQQEEWPGWLFYASVQFTPVNPWWREIGNLTGYITNCQNVLQNTTPDNELLLYFPVYDIWYNSQNLEIPFSIHNPEQFLYNTGFYNLADSLRTGGYQFDYISDRLLGGLKMEGDTIMSGTAKYRALVVPECRFMPPATLARLYDLAQQGAPVIFHRALPKDVPGYGNLKKRQQTLQKLINNIQSAHCKNMLVTNSIKNGLVNNNLLPEQFNTYNLQFIRKKLGQLTLYFVANLSAEPVEGWIPFQCKASSVWLSSPIQNCLGKGAFKPTADSLASQVYMQIAPGESCFLLFDLDMMQVMNYHQPVAAPVFLNGEWKVEFIEGGPDMPAPVTMVNLVSWTELADAEAQRFAGTARYSIHFDKPAFNAEEWQLDLGNVAESARVRLNGEEIGTVWCLPFRILLGNRLKDKDNLLELEVTNTAANRIIDLDKRGVNWKKFKEINFVNINYQPFDASHWQPMPGGLLGPVQLVPLREFIPE